jgi:hypothetical protein
MSSEIKIYKIKDLIRVNKKGVLDADRSIDTIHQLAATASFHADCNILLDSRDTVVNSATMFDIFKITLEFALYKSLFKNKIANVIPNNEKRISIAKKFKASMDVQDFEYKFFTDFEAAIEWLSDTTPLKVNDIP